MIQSKNTTHHHLASKNQKKQSICSGVKTISRSLLNVVVLICILIIPVYAGLDALDRSIYPGCKVISQTGDVLSIKINPAINTGSDSGYADSARLIHRICLDGYRVKVLNNFWVKDIIDLAAAEELVALNGGYGNPKGN